MNLSLSTLSVVAWILPAAAQSTLAWSTQYDAAANQADYGRTCAADAAGNLVVVAKSYNPTFGSPPLPPTADLEFLKWSPTGQLLWSARRDLFGGDDTPLDVLCDASGNVYASGYGWNGNNVQLVLVKYDANGVFQWQRNHQGPGTLSAFARAIALDASGNVALCGHESSLSSGFNALLQCYSPAGALLWSTSFDGGANLDDTLYAVVPMPNGDLVACGQFNAASGGTNVGVARFSSSGQLLSRRNDDGGGGLADGGATLCVVDAQRVAVAGWRTASTSGEDWFVGLYDVPTMTLQWSRTFGGTSNAGERARGVAFDARNVLWVLGPATNVGAGIDAVVRRYDLLGNLLTSSAWNGSNLDDPPWKLMPGSAGQMYAAGYTTMTSGSPSTYAMYVLQFDENGTRNWAGTYATSGVSDGRIFDAALAPQNAVVAGGFTTDGAVGNFDVLAMRVELAASPQTYCTPKQNSLGCSARLTFTGMPSAAATSGFTTFAQFAQSEERSLLLQRAGRSGESVPRRLLLRADAGAARSSAQHGRQHRNVRRLQRDACDGLVGLRARGARRLSGARASRAGHRHLVPRLEP
jgi:hypothetical protein